MPFAECWDTLSPAEHVQLNLNAGLLLIWVGRIHYSPCTNGKFCGWIKPCIACLLYEKCFGNWRVRRGNIWEHALSRLYSHNFPVLLWHQCFVAWCISWVFILLLQRPFGCNCSLYSLICACALEFVFNEYSNLHKGEFKSKVKHRILYSHATEVLHTCDMERRMWGIRVVSNAS